MIGVVGVVVPAHDEEELLPACLAALRNAAQGAGTVPVRLVVVADACGDQTAEVARRGGADVVEIDARNVGAARAVGVEEVLRTVGDLDPGAVWLACTDADTLVPPCWLARQLRYAEDGWDAVVGTVTVTDWTGHPPHLPGLFESRYRTDERGGHRHVHGANMAFTARSYLAAGGFPSRRTGEDHALVTALDATGARVLRTTDIGVVTSARRHHRVPHGFGHLLTTLATTVLPGQAPAGPPSPAPS